MKNLELNQMEKFNGGQAAPWNDAGECDTLADGLTGAAIVIGFASWWTGAGAGFAWAVGVAAAALSEYCEEL